VQDDKAIVDGKHTQINLDFYYHDASLGKNLTARGVAYVGYNADPGCHLRDRPAAKFGTM
jgi:hypothetical protein